MKREIVKYVAKCLICQQIKPKRQRLTGLLNPHRILEWKWEHVMMDFLFGLPRTSSGADGIWVIVDKLTVIAGFLPVKATYTFDKLAQMYVDKL